MLGAIAGDVIGSSYEWHGTKSPDLNFLPRNRLLPMTPC
jgi:hypothetical protein